MRKMIIEDTEVEMSSGNVFADLELPDADNLKIKSVLAIQIAKTVVSLGLSQEMAAKRMRLSKPRVSALLRGEFSGFSERKLMDCLNRLGYDIEIRVKCTNDPIGHVTLAVA